ncbi:MAG: hypothetical protein N2Z22_11170 [Turneriella sp.]|nr:hypothetical protein [Turneriella sp.]
MITFLFVIGVIGWGFFAIDRLTEPGANYARSRMQGRAAGQEASWKKTIREWLSQSLDTENTKKPATTERVTRNTGTIPLLPELQGLRPELEESLPIMEDPLLKSGEDQLLLYKLNSRGQPTLAKVRRDLAGKDLAARLNLVIRGPTQKELDTDYIDSFIRKPRVLRVEQKAGCMVVDMDENFGAGVSHQTLRFQIRQIFSNLQLWANCECLRLTVHGRYRRHLGSDGLYIPPAIDHRWLQDG